LLPRTKAASEFLVLAKVSKSIANLSTQFREIS
jgi:hypothetical protein